MLSAPIRLPSTAPAHWSSHSAAFVVRFVARDPLCGGSSSFSIEEYAYRNANLVAVGGSDVIFFDNRRSAEVYAAALFNPETRPALVGYIQPGTDDVIVFPFSDNEDDFDPEAEEQDFAIERDPEDVYLELLQQGFGGDALETMFANLHLHPAYVVGAMIDSDACENEDGFSYGWAQALFSRWYSCHLDMVYDERALNLYNYLAAWLGYDPMHYDRHSVKFNPPMKGGDVVRAGHNGQQWVLDYRADGQPLRWIVLAGTVKECYAILHGCTRTMAHPTKALKVAKRDTYALSIVGNNCLRVTKTVHKGVK